MSKVSILKSKALRVVVCNVCTDTIIRCDNCEDFFDDGEDIYCMDISDGCTDNPVCNHYCINCDPRPFNKEKK